MQFQFALGFSLSYDERTKFRFTDVLKCHDIFILFSQVFVYDGKSADNVGELGCPAHKAGVYAVSFKKKKKNYLF